jgi:hypothetical protein
MPGGPAGANPQAAAAQKAALMAQQKKKQQGKGNVPNPTMTPAQQPQVPPPVGGN